MNALRRFTSPARSVRIRPILFVILRAMSGDSFPSVRVAAE
jgi:hypothetical protein